MKKDTVIWVLIAVLFMGMAVLFTMNCSKSKYKSSGQKSWKQCCQKASANYGSECQKSLNKSK